MRVSPRSKAREKVLERRAKKARKIIINKFKMFAVKKILYDVIVLAQNVNYRNNARTCMGNKAGHQILNFNIILRV